MTFQEVSKQPYQEQPKMIEKVAQTVEQIRIIHAAGKAAQAIKDR